MIDLKKRKKPSKIELTIELIVISDEERWNKRPWSAQMLVNESKCIQWTQKDV